MRWKRRKRRRRMTRVGETTSSYMKARRVQMPLPSSRAPLPC
jgi:hypothetical protein